MKILITGVAGFIGSNLAELLKKSHDVVGIDDLSGGTEANIPRAVRWYPIDCRNIDQVNEVMRTELPDVVIHLAANAAEHRSQFSPYEITSRNHQASIAVISSALRYKVKRFIFASSIAVYGNIQSPFKEEDQPKPEDLYGISKLATEESLKVLCDIHGMEYVIVRPHNVYGPKQNMNDPYRNVVTLWMRAMIQLHPYYIYGDGSQRRCFTYVDDVTKAIERCLTCAPNQTFNIGSDTSHTLLELSKALKSPQEPTLLPDRVHEVHTPIADHTKAKDILGYTDTVTLEEGIEKTWKWAEKQKLFPLKHEPFEIMSDKIPRNWL